VIVFSVTGLLLLLAGVAALIPLGLRAGDQPGDALLLHVEPRTAPHGASVTITNRARLRSSSECRCATPGLASASMAPRT
jgi:hypothetical protein